MKPPWVWLKPSRSLLAEKAELVLGAEKRRFFGAPKKNKIA